MPTPQLITLDNHLGITLPEPSFCGDLEAILICRHPEGDCDTIPWPMVSDFRTKAELDANLRSALFDERECGNLPLDCQSVLLPDGSEFEID